MVVTVEARHGTDVPVINREDVMVYEGGDRAKVTDWVALQGDHASLELFILVDDASSTSLGSQLEDLRAFINSQPPTMAICVGYMRNGTVDMVQSSQRTTPVLPSLSAYRSVRPGISASPYFSLVDLIKHWPESPIPREIVMLSDGIDRYSGGAVRLTLTWTRQSSKLSAPAFPFSRSTLPVWATMDTASGG